MFSRIKNKLALIFSLKKDSNLEDFINTPHQYEMSKDDRPWEHPFLDASNIEQFRLYSEAVWGFAKNYASDKAPLNAAFYVNMAQNMYKWASLAKKYGASADLYLNVQDSSALSSPYWEEFYGDYADLQNGKAFLENFGQGILKVPCHSIEMGDSGLYQSYMNYKSGLPNNFLELLRSNRGIKYEMLFSHEGMYPYYNTADCLSKHEVIYAASTPFAAYASGKPYCAFSVGGDLQFDCGLNNSFGLAMKIAFNSAQFLFISNPHTLGHSRRLGFTNGMYLPYPMDTSKYCPGKGDNRKIWEQKYGRGFYVLMTSRIDKGVKGQDKAFWESLIKVVQTNDKVRFVFLSWGNSIKSFQDEIERLGFVNNFIFLSPVGKLKLIDYYRSCDTVLDQMVYGYYGATALEAASIGKPIIMKLRKTQYAPLQKQVDLPIFNVNSSKEIIDVILSLATNNQLCEKVGIETRTWVEKVHGEETTIPLMLNLLRLTADEIKLPKEIMELNPLTKALSLAEIDHHKKCNFK